MSRKTANILMLVLAVIYTLFITLHLVYAIRDKGCDNRLVYILSCALGVVCGVILVFAIIKNRHHIHKHHHKRRHKHK